MPFLGHHLGRGLQAGIGMSYAIKCFECGRTVTDNFADACPLCGGLLTVEMDLERLADLRPADLRKRPIGVWRYAPLLPACEAKSITLKEGGTPLYDCKAVANRSQLKKVYVKYEGANPTGSFKDRGMTVGVTRAVELGCKVVGCASTGNTSAALAAYAAKAGLECVVLLPSGKVAAGKLAQAMFYGAKIVSVDGNFDEALGIVRKLASEGELYLLNSINPFRPEGQKTVAFEIIDQLDFELPDRIILPVGNAANIWAVYKAFTEYRQLGWIDKIPKLTGVQAAGSAPIVDAYQHGSPDFVPEEHPETIATAIRIGNPASGKKSAQSDLRHRRQRRRRHRRGDTLRPAAVGSVGGHRRGAGKRRLHRRHAQTRGAGGDRQGRTGGVHLHRQSAQGPGHHHPVIRQDTPGQGGPGVGQGVPVRKRVKRHRP